MKQAKMIEINLLPDIKQEVLVARQTRDRVATWSIIISVAAASLVLILLMITMVVQALIIKSQANTIEEDFKKIERYNGVTSLLTIQNQLKNIDEMHSKKAVSSRIFILLNQLTSVNKLRFKASKIEYNPHNKKIIIEGSTDADESYAELERLIKTLDDVEVAFIDVLRFAEIGDKAKTPEEATKELEEELENSGYENLVEEKVSLLSDPSFGENADGKKVLTFKIGLELNEKFFLSAEKNMSVKGISYQDVTDSYLSVPNSLFEVIEVEEDVTKKENE